MSDDISPPPKVFFRPALQDDLPTIAKLEELGYPADEAATPENLAYRLEHAPDFFLAAVSLSGEVVGFVCGTLTSSSSLTHESMERHEDEGRMLCIHSVCVKLSERRKKIGLRLLRAYCTVVQQARPELEGIRLLCKEYLVHFYEQGGFSVVGPSAVQHGADQWIEMELAEQEEDADAA